MNSSDTLQHKIQGLEHSLVFLQDQHASTLNGLHEEISKLQQKCTGLINQLAQSGVNAESDERKAEPSLQAELKDSRHEHAKLKETLEVKEERIRMLESQSKSKDQKYQSDLKHYQTKAVELQTELEHKSASIAYLTSKLQQNQVTNTSPSNEAIARQANTKATILIPSPPKGNPNRQHDRKNIRCVASSPAANVSGFVLESTALQNPLAKCTSGRLPNRYKHSISDPPRPALGHSQNKRDHDMFLFSKPKPSDYEDFIKISQSEETITKSVIEPLPPIAPAAGSKQYKQTRTKAYSIKNQKPHSNTTGEVETVILEPGVSSTERARGKLQDLS